MFQDCHFSLEGWGEPLPKLAWFLIWPELPLFNSLKDSPQALKRSQDCAVRQRHSQAGHQAFQHSQEADLDGKMVVRVKQNSLGWNSNGGV